MHPFSRSGVAALAVGLLACRPAEPPEAPPAIDDPAPARPLASPAAVWSALPSTVRWPAGALAIALPPGEPAPWLLPRFEPGLEHPLDRLEEVAHSDRTALARTGDLLLVTDRDEGLVGTIALPPEITWVGMGGARILAADARGQLFAADAVGDALAHGLRSTGLTLAGATAWDAAGSHVIALARGKVMASDDGGRSFRASEPARGVTFEAAVVRADGVMVALSRGERVTAYASRDGGKAWQRSSWHPQALWREDAWIMGRSGEEVGVLASDGRAWAGGLDRDAALQGYRSWRWDFFTGSPEPSTGRWPTPTDPPAPAPPRQPLRGRPRPAGEGIFGGIGGTGMLGSVPACTAGLACLHGSVGEAPPPAQLDVRLFGDARCEVDQAPCPPDRWRAPHVGVFDHGTGTVRLGRLVRSCTAIELGQASGLGLVGCRHPEGTTLMVVETDGSIHAELEVTDAKPDVGYVMMAEDGTLLVPEIPACDAWARAWVRRPVEPGRSDAWIPLAVPGARTWRPVGRGYAVAVADRPGSEGRAADLWLAGPEREPARVLEGIPVLVGATAARVDDGRVSLHTDRWQVVRSDASLADVELPSRERVVGGVTIARAEPWLGCGERPTYLEP